MSLLDVIINKTNEYISNNTKKDRKELGQFFTSKETAIFMANLFSAPIYSSIRILDPGAGTGILSVAVIEKLINYDNVKNIELVCYENDDKVLNILKSNLTYIKQNIKIRFNFEIRRDDYIVSQSEQYKSNHPKETFDYVISNPPFMKIGKDHIAAKSMPDICYGAPNIYFLFMAMSAFNLDDNGQMVYIVPRSWTSGLYFQQFRSKFLKECSLTNIHLFISRDKVFNSEDVLQETMILKAVKTVNNPNTICMSTTYGNEDFSNISTFDAPYNTVVSGKNKYVLLITSENDIQIINAVSKQANTLPNIGLPMKTGLTVDFRNKDLLRNNSEENIVPLFYPYHIKNGLISFPSGRSNEYILTNKKGLLQNNANYLFVKRFTAKEEQRRLQCGIYLSKNHPDYSKISTQNKINFIGGSSFVSDEIIYGLYVVFNSTIYDKYYRILNGSTQVNSSEINSIPVPSLNVLKCAGKSLMSSGDLSVQTCDLILHRYI